MPRGRRPTPTKILQLRGSWRAKTRPFEPQPPAEKPPCPPWLTTPEEKQLWRQLVTQLHPLGLLAKIDGAVLGRYVVLSVQWRAALAFVREHGPTYPVRDEAGRVIGLRPFPQMTMVRGLHRELLAVEALFGMSPSARTALHVEPPAPREAENPKAKFFRTPG